MVEYLLSMFRALHSIPTTAHKWVERGRKETRRLTPKLVEKKSAFTLSGWYLPRAAGAETCLII